MVKIVVDAFGGDNSPDANILGTISALNKHDDIFVYLTGDEKILTQKLQGNIFDKKRLEIIDAPEIISCEEKPTDAIRQKPNSSMVKALEFAKNNDDVNALVSLGSTGALLAGTILKRLGRIQGVSRPALCPVLPTMAGTMVGICDSGANANCDAVNLFQFAIMGSLYLKHAFGIKNPKVALLNVGIEETKGDTLRQEVYPMLKNSSMINFVGNMESRDLLSGKYDLVVCDGFSGNVLLKSTEGACSEMLKLIKKTFTKSIKTKMGALLLKKDMRQLKTFMNYNNYGGAVI